ncbi:MAG: hypothetical protein WKF58_17285 [Ilumatobacteraceae bacterium]
MGASPQWHGDVLAELGMLHLLARGGRSIPNLPSHLADSLATALGWQVRQADVLDGVPETDTWDVIGRSDTREDRIEVRRTWLRARTSARLAMVLSFAAYRQSLDRSLPVGTAVEADLHRYPGAGARAIVGARRSEVPAIRSSGMTLAAACEAAGAALAAEPWAERTVVTVARCGHTVCGELGRQRRDGLAAVCHRTAGARRGARHHRWRSLGDDSRVDAGRAVAAVGASRGSHARHRSTGRSLVRGGGMSALVESPEWRPTSSRLVANCRCLLGRADHRRAARDRSSPAARPARRPRRRRRHRPRPRPGRLVRRRPSAQPRRDHGARPPARRPTRTTGDTVGATTSRRPDRGALRLPSRAGERSSTTGRCSRTNGSRRQSPTASDHPATC